MRRSRRPGDLPLPRPLPRGTAAEIYRLGRAAGEREARNLREQLAQLADAAEAGADDIAELEWLARAAEIYAGDVDEVDPVPRVRVCAPRLTRRRR